MAVSVSTTALAASAWSGVWRLVARDRRDIRAFVLAVLAVDLLFIGIDLFAGAAPTFPERFHVFRDRGWPEILQYFQWIAAAGATLVLGSRVALYRVWTLIFLYLLLDDAFSLHELVGDAAGAAIPVSERLGLPVPSWVIMQLAYIGAVALVAVVSVLLVRFRTADPAARRYSAEALVLLAVFATFAVVGDAISGLVFGGAHTTEVLEDGGEMIACTLLAAHAVLHAAAVARSIVAAGRQGNASSDRG